MQHGIDTLVLAGSCLQEWNVNKWILGNAKLKYVSFRWCLGTVLGIFGCCVRCEQQEHWLTKWAHVLMAVQIEIWGAYRTLLGQPFLTF